MESSRVQEHVSFLPCCPTFPNPGVVVWFFQSLSMCTAATPPVWPLGGADTAAFLPWSLAR